MVLNLDDPPKENSFVVVEAPLEDKLDWLTWNKVDFRFLNINSDSTQNCRIVLGSILQELSVNFFFKPAPT